MRYLYWIKIDFFLIKSIVNVLVVHVYDTWNTKSNNNLKQINIKVKLIKSCYFIIKNLNLIMVLEDNEVITN